MKQNSILLWSLTASFSLAFAGHTHAGLRQFRKEHKPFWTGVRVVVPSMKDIKDVPVRKEGKVIPNPVEIVGYGLNLHPGSRVVRAAYRKVAGAVKPQSAPKPSE